MAERRLKVVEEWIRSTIIKLTALAPIAPKTIKNNSIYKIIKVYYVIKNKNMHKYN